MNCINRRHCDYLLLVKVMPHGVYRKLITSFNNNCECDCTAHLIKLYVSDCSTVQITMHITKNEELLITKRVMSCYAYKA